MGIWEVDIHSTQGKKKRALSRRIVNHKGDSNLAESKIRNKPTIGINKSDILSAISKTGIFLDIQRVIKERTFPEGGQIFYKENRI
jgi:hypothetical protein